jgi:hypothetical protein
MRQARIGRFDGCFSYGAGDGPSVCVVCMVASRVSVDCGLGTMRRYVRATCVPDEDLDRKFILLNRPRL